MNEPIILEAGVDEAGRGPLAGPVMAAAVILDPKNKIEGLKDSKSLSSKRRSELEKEIKEKSIAWNVASINRAEIDSINILQASLKAMREAVRGLSQSPQKILLDGNNPIDVGIPCEAIISGDKKIESIMAASILAKEERDRYMLDLDKKFPVYNFKDHKGYGTKVHNLTLNLYGPCEEHRRSFTPVKKAIQTGPYKYVEEKEINERVRKILISKPDKEIKVWLKSLKETESEEDYDKIRNALNEEWEFIQKGKKKR